jgi:hypothetical protein
MNRHPWWYDQVKTDLLSGGDLNSNFQKDKPGEAEYRAEVPRDGSYEFWVRANPVEARLSYRLDGGDWTPIDLERDRERNIAPTGSRPRYRWAGRSR